jgi:hypothetical protein
MESQASPFGCFSENPKILNNRNMSLEQCHQCGLWMLHTRGVMYRRAKSKGELRRLAGAEADWNLGHGILSTRTRLSSISPDDLLQERESVRPVVPEIVDVVDNDRSEDSQLTVDPSVDDRSTAQETLTPVFAKKPAHSRVLLEVSQLQQAFEHYPCPKCNARLALKLRTVCIATSIELICNNDDCSYQCNFNRPTPTTYYHA